MSINVFNDSANIGPILDGIKNTIVGTESLITLDVDDSITPIPISAYGKTLLDSTSLADLRSQLLENTNQEAIRLLDDSNSEINFYTSGTTASNLRLQITDSNTYVKNILNSSVVKTSAVRSDQNDSSTLIQSNDGTTNIRFVPQNSTISYLQNYGTLAFTKIGEGSPILAINHTDGQKLVYTNAEFNINVTAADNTYALYKCPAGEQVSLYSHSGLSEGFLIQKATYDNGVKINQFHNGVYAPIYLHSSNQSKLVIGTENIQADTEKFIVASTSRFKADVVCDNTIKLIGPNSSVGSIYCRDLDGAPNITNLDNINMSYNLNYNRLTNTETVVKASERSARIKLSNGGIWFEMSELVNGLPSRILEISSGAVVAHYRIVPAVNNTTDIGIDDGSTMYRFRDCYLTQNLDIKGTSSRVILTDSSVADNTIRSSGVCGNTIVGVKSQTSDTGVGFLRLAAGIETTQQINETYIDLYGANSTDTYQSIRHIVNNSEIFVIDTNTAEFKQNLITRTIYPESDITHSLGLSGTNEWLNVYTENIYVSGQQHHSDRRIKDNIIDLPNDKGLSFIKKLRPVQYTYIKSTQKRKHWGFIAQEIREVVGSDYSIWGEQKTEFKKQHIAPSEFLGPIVKSIQELYDIVTSSSDKPVIIKEQDKSVDHKCNNLELLNSLNSYEVQLLENENKLKQMDSNIEELCDENSILKVKNSGLEKRVTELEIFNKSLNEKLEKLENTKQDDNLLTEDDENSGIMDIMNQRFLELEARLLKSEAKSKKLTTALNKLLKEK